MSFARAALNAWLRAIEKPMLAKAQDPKAIRRSFERKARVFFHGPRVLRTQADIAGVSALRLGAAKADCTILYLHGGGYVFGSPRTHAPMVSWLVSRLGMPAVLPDYRLAPEHPHPAAIEDALEVYRALAKDGPVVIGGDSAGGGLALALLAEILRLGLPLPLGVFALSPLTDLTFSGDSFRRNAERDALLPATRANDMGRMFLAGQDATDPRASPLFAEFIGAPPVWLTVSDTEILLDDTRRIAQHLRAQGVTVTERVEHDLPHVWTFFHNVLPEARATLRAVAAWITSLERRSVDS